MLLPVNSLGLPTPSHEPRSFQSDPGRVACGVLRGGTGGVKIRADRHHQEPQIRDQPGCMGEDRGEGRQQGDSGKIWHLKAPERVENHGKPSHDHTDGHVDRNPDRNWSGCQMGYM